MIKINTTQEEKEVGFLVDSDLDFVSLVRHGANQQPFKIIKEDNKGGESVKVIQSILLPADEDIQKLITEPGMEYLSEAQIEEVLKTDEYQAFTQIPADKVENYQLLKAGAGWLVIGSIKKDEVIENALSVTEEQIEKLDKLPIPEAFSDDSWMLDYGPTFMDGVSREIYAMVDVIQGTLRQANTNPANRKKSIFNAIASFKSFMGLALDALGGGMANTDPLTVIKEKLEGEDIMFKTQEDFEAAAGTLIDAKLDAFMVKMDEKLEGLKAPEPVVEPEAPVEKSDTPDPIQEALAALTAKIESFGTQLTEVKTKVDGALETDPAQTPEATPPEPVSKEEKTAHIFDGFLTRKVA